ncbi:hypothetical protein M427DRAFT_419482 [Gonapodya prolifera JEL478]|uniref:Uncharacterized protein n=1 Tax=Gonapodya prolifera (strain JEL478) TaxID=1344416 RepID=A0A139A5X6_GONPJ|nr:hypothetical protein M427DRAFT_419482 [Gonapodya prolifera JEL478]|eukprot:KXS11773.1 hypothetical protein M427DRAFT_419482 [Gonapodya prolifera JEL478]
MVVVPGASALSRSIAHREGLCLIVRFIVVLVLVHNARLFPVCSCDASREGSFSCHLSPMSIFSDAPTQLSTSNPRFVHIPRHSCTPPHPQPSTIHVHPLLTLARTATSVSTLHASFQVPASRTERFHYSASHLQPRYACARPSVASCRIRHRHVQRRPVRAPSQLPDSPTTNTLVCEATTTSIFGSTEDSSSSIGTRRRLSAGGGVRERRTRYGTPSTLPSDRRPVKPLLPNPAPTPPSTGAAASPNTPATPIYSRPPHRRTLARW